ncbi:OmpA family protein [Iamia majanohamensis]|uniref:OmpA family protein n=1 Tax=Iamia majanohamensis TaxID=467976 RepID=A0AAE9Y8P0_9ACTN|nr:OmpA family protein [Iamia majanohamensis]WCO68944.1 OmpA family protein [Iamia majanohamensis]
MEPLAPLPPVGAFAPLDAIGPVGRSCGTLVTLTEAVLFDFGSDQLRPDADTVLDKLADVVNEADVPIAVPGHTDSIGEEDANLDLSRRRADAVRTALVDRGVITEVTTEGYGESRPVAPNTQPDGSDDPAGRQMNRRVEIVIGDVPG